MWYFQKQLTKYINIAAKTDNGHHKYTNLKGTSI